MTGPVKIDESPYKVSNKREFLSQGQLNKIEMNQSKRLTHAHNLLMKKRLNQYYFDVNKSESKESIFKISPDDFVFEDRTK
jgi:hypothetical protein